MPAAAVIPAPIAYIKVVAVKKLVVGSQAQAGGPARAGLLLDCRRGPVRLASSVPGQSWATSSGSAGVTTWVNTRRFSPALLLVGSCPRVLFAERPGWPTSLL